MLEASPPPSPSPESFPVLIRLSGCFAAVLALATPAAAQCEIVRLDPNAPVNVGPTPVLVGSMVVFPTQNEAVTLFHHAPHLGWFEGVTFQAGGGGLFYGMFTAAEEDVIATSFPDGGNGVGRVRLFERETAWDVATDLDPGGLAFGDVFGASLAMGGETIVVGATMDLFMSGAYGPGKAFVFERRGGVWETAARFAPTGYSDTLTEFGFACDTDGETVAIGAPNDDEAGTGAGAVYIYERGPSGWAEAAKLFPGIPQAGEVVAVEGNFVFVGALAGSGGGAVHVYERIGGVWTAAQVLLGSDTSAGDRFGSALDVADGRLVVGAPFADGHDIETGKVYVFTYAGGAWTEELQLSADDVPAGYRLGSRVSLSGNQVLVSPLVGPEVRLYSLGMEDLTSFCSSSANSTGAPAVLTATGCDSVGANEVIFRAEPVPADQFGALLFARKPAQVPFGNGLLCIAAPILRGPVTASDAGGVLEAQLSLAKGPGQAILSGSTWHFQAFFRDPGFGAGFDTSDGLRLVFQP